MECEIVAVAVYKKPAASEWALGLAVQFGSNDSDHQQWLLEATTRQMES